MTGSELFKIQNSQKKKKRKTWYIEPYRTQKSEVFPNSAQLKLEKVPFWQLYGTSAICWHSMQAYIMWITVLQNLKCVNSAKFENNSTRKGMYFFDQKSLVTFFKDLHKKKKRKRKKKRIISVLFLHHSVDYYLWPYERFWFVLHFSK